MVLEILEQQSLYSMQCVPSFVLGAVEEKKGGVFFAPPGIGGQTCPLREHHVMLGILLGDHVMAGLRILSWALRWVSMGDLVRLREGKAFQ